MSRVADQSAEIDELSSLTGSKKLSIPSFGTVVAGKQELETEFPMDHSNNFVSSAERPTKVNLHSRKCATAPGSTISAESPTLTP